MINFIDEVLNTASTQNKIKYKITHSDNSTEIVEIDLQTPVTQQGTPLNRATFETIKSHLDLIGKYNTPTSSSSATYTSGSYIPEFSAGTPPTRI